MWSRDGHSVMRSLGRAWVEPDGKGGWRRGIAITSIVDATGLQRRFCLRIRLRSAAQIGPASGEEEGGRVDVSRVLLCRIAGLRGRI
jgi:hypothetical protein